VVVLTTCAKNVLRIVILKDVNQVIHIPDIKENSSHDACMATPWSEEIDQAKAC
jgi:hypothetical protein